MSGRRSAADPTAHSRWVDVAGTDSKAISADSKTGMVSAGAGRATVRSKSGPELICGLGQHRIPPFGDCDSRDCNATLLTAKPRLPFFIDDS